MIYKTTGYLSNVFINTLHVKYCADKVQSDISIKLKMNKSDFEKYVDYPTYS